MRRYNQRLYQVLRRQMELENQTEALTFSRNGSMCVCPGLSPFSGSVVTRRSCGVLQRVEGSLQIRMPMGSTSDWQRSPQPSELTAASSPPGKLLRYGLFKGFLLRTEVDDLLGRHVIAESGYSTVAVRVHEHELAEVFCRSGAPS